MRIRPFLAIILLSHIPFSIAQSAEERSLALQHPQIRAIRAIYQAVETDIAGNRLKKEQRELSSCEGGLAEDRIAYTDSAGHVRKYVLAGGSSDSALTLRHELSPLLCV